MGTPHTWWSLAAASCSACTVAIGRAAVDLGEHGVGVDAVLVEHPRAPRPRRGGGRRGRGAARTAPRGRRGTGRGTCRARPRPPAGRAGPESSCQRPQMSGSPSADVHLAERERHEGHVPRGSGAEPDEHVLVGVAGEGAAVVPGDGEGAAVVVTLASTTASAPGIPSPSGLGPHPARDGGQADADGGAGDDVGRVVHLHVDAARRHHHGQRRSRAATAGSPWLSTPAAVNAALAWPDGKLLVSGRRMRCGRGRSSSHTGRWRLNRLLIAPFTSSDSAPRIAERRTARHRVAPGQQRLPGADRGARAATSRRARWRRT